MRGTRTARAVVACLLTTIVVPVTAATSAHAATAAQTCTGPSATTQAGNATITPGLNALAQRQQVGLLVHLFQCSPSGVTNGSGTVKSTYTTLAPYTCTYITAAHTTAATATITWKNSQTSTVALSLSFTGSTRLLNVSGKVTAGLFASHSVSGQYHYKPVISPNGNTLAQACANTVAPGDTGRIKVAGLTLFATAHFVIT